MLDISIVSNPWDSTAWRILGDQCGDLNLPDKEKKCRVLADTLEKVRALPTYGVIEWRYWTAYEYYGARFQKVHDLPEENHTLFAALSSLAPFRRMKIA